MNDEFFQRPIHLFFLKISTSHSFYEGSIIPIRRLVARNNVNNSSLNELSKALDLFGLKQINHTG